MPRSKDGGFTPAHRKDSFGYRHSNHSVGLANVHLVWIPKRRKPVLKGRVRWRLSEILDAVAADNEWIIKAKEIAPDHVHLMVEYDAKTSIAKVVKAFKGRSSRLLRNEFPHLLKLPSLWTLNYFYDTSGKVSTEKIMAYINDPHHDRH
ncbi:MAG: IS200/IS605 family transposase [Cyanobacteria bacterium P01_F01_bin.3]